MLPWFVRRMPHGIPNICGRNRPTVLQLAVSTLKDTSALCHGSPGQTRESGPDILPHSKKEKIGS
jgi:hypothetical protein